MEGLLGDEACDVTVLKQGHEQVWRNDLGHFVYATPFGRTACSTSCRQPLWALAEGASCRAPRGDITGRAACFASCARRPVTLASDPVPVTGRCGGFPDRKLSSGSGSPPTGRRREEREVDGGAVSQRTATRGAVGCPRRATTTVARPPATGDRGLVIAFRNPTRVRLAR